MVGAPTLAEEILEWKRARNAIILAHYYQEAEIQKVADLVGDTIELSRAAQKSSADVVAFCGVRFMAETAKLLNPERTVLLPDMGAGCSLADSCPVDGVRAFRRRHPDHMIVSSIKTSIDVKAESDILCTPSNAVRVVHSIPRHKPILFLPDINLGNYVKGQTGRENMQIWQGACILHATFQARRVVALQAEHPEAFVAAHPECPEAVLRRADFAGSASAIIRWCASHTGREFIIAAESGLRYLLEKESPEKTFHFVASENCNCSECSYMKVNSPEKLVACLERLEPRIEISEQVARRARLPLERMLELGPA